MSRLSFGLVLIVGILAGGLGVSLLDRGPAPLSETGVWLARAASSIAYSSLSSGLTSGITKSQLRLVWQAGTLSLDLSAMMKTMSP